jgi:hypothetical protein
MPSATFRFGPAREHEVSLVCGYFGTERYFVNGRLVRSQWSLHPTGSREFQAFGHRVRIDLSANLKRVEANAFVDGELVATDLFAKLNEQFARQRQPRSLLVAVLVGFVAAFVVFTLSKAFSAAI